MQEILRAIVAPVIVAFAMGGSPATAEQQSRIGGYLETVCLKELDLEIRAKLDTGADNSSLHAENIELFEKDGEDWVRFQTETKDGEMRDLEHPVNDIIRIKGATGDNYRRPEIMLTICLGGIEYQAPVNLSDREDYTTHFLLGRSYLKQGILVDSSRKDLLGPTCRDEHP